MVPESSSAQVSILLVPRVNPYSKETRGEFAARGRRGVTMYRARGRRGVGEGRDELIAQLERFWPRNGRGFTHRLHELSS